MYSRHVTFILKSLHLSDGNFKLALFNLSANLLDFTINY